MKVKECFNSKFLSLVLLSVVILSFFLIKNNDVKNVDTLVSQSPLPISKKLSQLPPELPVKNSGKILSIQYGGGYTFIEVELPSKKSLFLATGNLPNNILVGNIVRWKNSRLSKNYYSHALKRNFENLLMVTLQDESIKSGVVKSVKSVKTVDKNTFISVRYEHSTQELIVKSDRISGELFVGNIIEWQQENLSINDQSKNNNRLSQSPLMVDWIRKSKK
jgi:hypothetical protein